jgi:hypothetical protein
MVINLYKQSLNQDAPGLRLEVLTELAKAITKAHIEGKPTTELEELKADVEYLSSVSHE